MRIRTKGNNPQNEERQVVDIGQIYLKLQEEHEQVFMTQIEGQIFIFKPLGRIEYRDLVNDQRFDVFAKEELICQACTLYPEGYDFEDCIGGIPTTLAKEIIKASYLDSIESRLGVSMHYREEMYDLDNQITCIIHEAFQNISIEEIESWGVEKTAKYLSKAEWILQNLRGGSLTSDPLAAMYQYAQGEQQKTEKDGNVQTEEIKPQQKAANANGSNKKPQLTPEQLEELKRKYPEMQWGDNVLRPLSENDIIGTTVDTTAPALRPGR